MVNKCCVYGCKSGYLTTGKKVSSFRFPFYDLELRKKWISFVNRRDWEPTTNSVICVLHFESKYINDVCLFASGQKQQNVNFILFKLRVFEMLQI